MDFIIQCPRKYARPVCTPSNRGDRAPELVHAHWLLRALVAPLPDTDGAVIAAGGNELDASASCESSVQGINDTTVSVEFTHALASCEVCDVQGVVGRDSVEDLGCEGPLEVEDGGFVEVGYEAVVGVWRVRAP